MAVTQFPERPEVYEGKWLPDQVFAMFASDPQMAFSIGFAYTQVRQPTKKDCDRYGRDGIKRIVNKSRLLEYSVAPLLDAIAVSR